MCSLRLSAVVGVVAVGLCTLIAGDDYWSDRQAIIVNEQQHALGGTLKLNANEELANAVLMRYKEAEWTRGFAQPDAYAPNLHFFHAKPLIDGSKVFKILKQLPKGLLLHTHDTGMASFDFLFNLTFTPNLYICTDDSDFELRFFKVPDDALCTYGAWESLADKRARMPEVDNMLRATLSLVCDDPHASYKDINAVWSRFQTIFYKVAPLLTYKPIFEAYHYQSLLELAEDNVQYVELRTTLPDLYDLQGRVYKNGEVVRTYKETTERFKRDHPEFMGARIIYAPPRNVTNETMSNYIDILHDIKGNYSDFVMGFDLVGQEDTGVPLRDFIPHLLPLKDKVKFFFHAGETDWYGADTDENLIDAILLGTTRVGHGYALLKHPELLRRIKENSIAIEVAPISNQVLKLVDDVRNHPAAVFSAFGLPLVVTNDDPSYWGAKGLSYDWYMMFMGIASRHDDLRFLKKLALNSIEFSGMGKADKMKIYKLWLQDWRKFVEKLASEKLP